MAESLRLDHSELLRDQQVEGPASLVRSNNFKSVGEVY